MREEVTAARRNDGKVPVKPWANGVLVALEGAGARPGKVNVNVHEGRVP